MTSNQCRLSRSYQDVHVATQSTEAISAPRLCPEMPFLIYCCGEVVARCTERATFSVIDRKTKRQVKHQHSCTVSFLETLPVPQKHESKAKQNWTRWARKQDKILTTCISQMFFYKVTLLQIGNRGGWEWGVCIYSTAVSWISHTREYCLCGTAYLSLDGTLTRLMCSSNSGYAENPAFTSTVCYSH